ncbi:hypothetical protein CLI64_03550 [Nostoc sp. CENA543]|nr:hypothetical protein CLI64_03550 [Nostoc sp. CENA543]
MQPAAAQRSSGNQQSGMGGNETFIGFQFNLFDTDESGNLIVDSALGNTVGLFKGAITNYAFNWDYMNTGRLPMAESMLQPSDYDADGHPLLSSPVTNIVTQFAVGDLLAELIIGADGKQYIRYTIYQKYGVTAPYSNFILDPKSPGKTFNTLPNPIDINKAVNDLSYILNNNLLDAVKSPNPALNLLLNDIDNSIFPTVYIIKTGVIKPAPAVNSDFNRPLNLR